MSDVPWAPRRRALVRVLPDGTWFEGIARVHEDGHVEGPVTDAHRANIWYNGDLDVFALDDDAETSMLPDQCPRCYAVEAHEDGCMVATNLARGVPEFWAPWAMWKDPAELPVGIRLFHLDPENPPNGGFYLCDVVAVIPGRASRLALVAIGPEGPTLAPWGKE